ncbi:MAG TPA: phosphoribosylanthranilate isomerase [Burkholderiales bacterium]
MTRVKICGITRPEDAIAAARSGADAIGLMFYPPSPRCVTPEQARRIVAAVPPFVTLVGVFVDPAPEEVRAVLSRVPLHLLQFHGDEAPEFCAGFGFDYIKAARVRPGLDLVQYAARHGAARGLLLDAYVPGSHGGTGQSFDWALIPRDLPLPLVLSGGLDASNVAEAVRRLRPWAVDVSSGVESARGIKDPVRISAFIRGVRDADV